LLNTFPEEIKSFVRRLVKEKETQKVYVFKRYDITYVWVVVDKAEIDLERKYSGIFFSMLEKYPSLNCDFLVFGRNEIEHVVIPENAVVVHSK